ncbi:inositol polyphosphate multikinase beta [Phtheirospermum japonicum]|uniref:Inositol polyphosphate multikinase n=1 Tax=Phtheirospermum japonicum TaxID=374723 RepID=A0A830BV35_9LAMI|nr:inositol polyphosphate multikinase beta [Phtheirospermum japonicum]
MLKVPDHQVAGHKADGGKLGPLIDESGRFYKPLQGDKRGSNEVAFYTSFTSNTKIPDHITRFFPKFYGTQLIEASDGTGMKPHMVLQDLTSDRVNPSVMDVKMGSRTWAPQSPEDYIDKCFKKDKGSTSVSLGFRLSGLQVFESKESGFWKPTKSEVKSLSTDDVRLFLKKYVSSNASDPKPDCAFASIVYGGSAGILSQLLELKAWFEDQTIYHFYSCSVLMISEKGLATNGKRPRSEIKLVDFAHVFEGNGIIDHNFLGGLCSLIKFISEILTTPEDSVADELLEDGQNSHIYSENGSVRIY